MKVLVVIIVSLFLGACASTPAESDRMQLPSPEGEQKPVVHPPYEATHTPRGPVSEPNKAPDINWIQSQLGMKRDLTQLGYAEKAFDGCRMGVREPDGKCGSRYYTQVNFRLVCRDTEDTTEEVVTNVKPVVTDAVQWKLAGLNGVTSTDHQGYGQVQIVSNKPQRGQRLVLTVGKQFLGLEISQVRQIVVPVYWCNQLADQNINLAPVRFVTESVDQR